jgi:hypothetical protein
MNKANKRTVTFNPLLDVSSSNVRETPSAPPMGGWQHPFRQVTLLSHQPSKRQASPSASSSFSSDGDSSSDDYATLSNKLFTASRNTTAQTSLEENDAYYEYLRTEPLPPQPGTESALFVSSDPRENRDNSPSRWASVRDLKDDEARKNFAARQVKNSIYLR